MESGSTDGSGAASVPLPDLFRRLCETSTDAILVSDGDGRILLATGAVREVLGYAPEELAGRTVDELVPERFRAGHRRGRSRYLDAPVPRLVGTDSHPVALRKDGTEIPVQIMLAPVNADGRTLALSTVREATDLREVVRSAAEARSRYRDLFREVTDAMYVTTRDGRIVDANPAMTRLLGYFLEELREVNARDLYADPGERDRFQELIEREGEVRNFEVDLVRRDGGVRHCLLSTSLRTDADGAVLGYQGIIHDVTGRRRQAERLRRQNDALARITHREMLPSGGKGGASADPFLRTAMEATRETLAVAGVGVWLLDGDGRTMRCRGCIPAVPGAEAEEPTFDLSGAPFLVEVMREGRTVAVEDVREQEGLGPLGATGESPAETGGATLLATVRAGGELRGVLACRHAGGPRRWHPDEERFAGSVADLVSLALERAEHRRTELALRESEERFRTIAEAIPVPLVISGLADGRIRYANRHFVEAAGLEGRDPTDLDLGDFYAESGEREELRRRLREEGALTGYETEATRADGTRRWVTATIRPGTYDGERVAVTAIQDITDRRRVEEEVRRANRALETLSEGREAVLRADDEEGLLRSLCRVPVEVGRYRMAWIGLAEDDEARSVRPAAAAGVEEGYLDGVEITWADGPRGRGPTGTAIRTRASSVMRRIDSDPAYEPWREEALRRGYASSAAVPIVTGGECYGALNIYAEDPDAFDEREVGILEELAGDLAFGLHTLRMRRERERLEEELRQSRKLGAIGELAGGVAHDFNNSLAVITTLTEILLEDLDADDPVGADIEEIRKAAERSARLTRQLLAFSRKQVLRPEVVDVSETLASMEPMLHRLLGERVRVGFELEPEVEPVHIDPGQLEQVMMNLAVNARDAMPGGGTLTVRTRNVEVDEELAGRYESVEPAPHVELAVADSGGGMDEETRERVFEPFFTTREGGTGLGLSTVYGIVKQSGGHIWVESAPGEGTTFRIHFPRYEGKGKKEADARSPEEGPAVPGGRETILLVEDDDAVRSVVRRILERHGYRVLPAGCAADAIELCEGEEKGIDLLLSDVVLPDMRCREMAAALRRLHPDLKVLYASGYPADQLGREGILDEGISFVPKPFEPDELVRRIREVLDAHGGPSEEG